MTKKKNSVTTKNYFRIMVITILCVCFVTYLYNVYNNYLDEKNKNSYLSRVVGEVGYDELDSVLVETVDDYYLYFTYINKKDILELEEDLKEIIIKNNLENNFYIVNVSDKYKEEDFYNNLNKKLNIKTNKIEEVPSIVYFDNGKLSGIISSTKDKMLSANEFKTFISENKKG